MGLCQVLCMGLLAAVARSQELQDCSVDTSSLVIGSTEDAAALATSLLNCSNGDFAVEWVGEVVVEETFRVTGGTSLIIAGAGPGATADGGGDTQLFAVDGGSRLHLSDMVLSNGNASYGGGAIFANQSSVSFAGNMSFISNSAQYGGAIFAQDSTVSWEGESTEFSTNSATFQGGAVYAWDASNVSWKGAGTEFISNYAVEVGGAILAQDDSTVSWEGDGTAFISNAAVYGGGAIFVNNLSTVSWAGDGTAFISNSANGSSVGVGVAGAICAIESSNVSWAGDGTQFSYNYGSFRGGAIYLDSYSTVSWADNGTEFISNSAGSEGGAICARSSTLLLGANTTFSSNFAGENGGALAVSSLDGSNGFGRISAAVFIDNTAGTAGGGVFLSNIENVEIYFRDVTFQSNSAGSGGALAALATGDQVSSTRDVTDISTAVFVRCIFFDNRAEGSGGAVETLGGWQQFFSCDFVGNSAGVGGAMTAGGITMMTWCSFHSNYATSRGLAIAAVSSTVYITAAWFKSNELYCEADLYRHDEDGITPRFETVCLDCPEWDECEHCTIERGNVTSTCKASLEYTTASEPGATLETLDIDEGYWRATNTSEQVLACYNANACLGGVTGAESYCAPGYTGPYCAVCEPGYSPSLGHTCTRCSSSRRQGLVAATVIAALVAVFAVATIFKFLSSTEVEEGNIGCFHRRVLGAVPVQALKIIVVVWQILTQFADAANVTYPGVYQDFLNAIDVVNFDLGSVLAAGCLWSGVDFHDRLLVSTLGPLVVVGFLVLTYRIAVRRNGASNESAIEKIRHKHQTALLLVTFLVYSSVSSMVFQTFACETLDDGIEYLRADYRIHCTDAKHKAFEVYAGFMVFAYPVGIPLLYAALLFQRRDVLAKDDEKRTDADKSVAQPISGLWEAYRPERFYYEVFECGRRILLTGVVVFIFPNTAAQIAITMLIAFFFFAVFEVLSPYTSESDMWLSRGGHVIVFLSMFDLLLLKVDVSGERDQSQAAFAGVLVAGHVLMILAIVVEVIGVCYASRKKKIAEGGVEASERPRVGSDDVPAFESAPAPWRSFFRQGSVSEKTGPTRSVSGTVVTTGGP